MTYLCPHTVLETEVRSPDPQYTGVFLFWFGLFLFYFFFPSILYFLATLDAHSLQGNLHKGLSWGAEQSLCGWGKRGLQP